MADQITSFSNPLVKRIKRLQKKKYRQREEAFFVEGLRVVLTAVEQEAPLETIIYSPELLTSDIAWSMLREQQALGTRCQAVSSAIFASVSGRDNPVGLGAIVKARWTNLESMSAGSDDIFIALFEVGEPGNLGTIMRTMDAVGASGLILVGHTVDPFHPSAVKASMGTLFSIRIARAPNADRLFSWAGEHELDCVASSAKGATSYTEAHYSLPLLLLLGSEGAGLPPATMARCATTVTIPMAGSASSLNLAVAAGLLLFEARRANA